ncbi:MAG: 50S ribosomal protein L9 [Cellvibrionales bacterium]|jgi:large subunit ribosomal protein L9|nr:50S ribosomal protein L9 [Cellvibrionales bacterium]MCH9843434.1 50S ribosomal protein L9 [Gammaproteobacteria bacterium]MDA7736798.1 50S ribosomal protein L9 [Porticoccus sp.]MDC0412065.1 50S ribosomal protein L9 [Porticoccus sp.]MDC1093759.1 50S ribosomal protein L9 [Porticoccus sp.]
MDVILLEKVGNLGNIGDKVSVKAGFGRNYLIPNEKAVFATSKNLVDFEERRSELEAAALAGLEEANSRASSIEAIASITIDVKASDEGKLFGSVGTKDIADAIINAGVQVEKSEIKLPDGSIREVGEFDILIQLHADVTQVVKLLIVAE